MSVAADRTALRVDRWNKQTYAQAYIRPAPPVRDWLEAGERVAVELALHVLPEPDVLDIGIGDGRTSAVLAPLARSYCGIDYVQEAIARAERNFPERAFRLMDARAMQFADGSFDFALFSFNGIDSVDPSGRAQIMREVRRVLRPGGMFVFSSLNRHGNAFNEGIRGWLAMHRRNWSGTWRDPLRLGNSAARSLLNLARYARSGSAAKDMRLISAHHFGLAAMFVSFDEQVAALRRHGFDIVAVIDGESGLTVTSEAASRGLPWLYYVAVRTAAPGEV